MGKKRKLREKAEAAKKDASKKKDNLKTGQTSGLSGKELFSYNPNIAKEDDDDDEGYAVDMNLREKEDEDDTKVHEIKFDEYGIMDDGIDETTNVQLARARGEEVPDGATAAPAVDVDEDLFD